MVANNREENRLISDGFVNIAGIDESGMGCFAGDVYVGAVVFPVGFDYEKFIPGLNDSKKKTEEQRLVLYSLIKKHASSWCVATASVDEIDINNIYWARFIAARRAIAGLDLTVDYVLVDGNAEIPSISCPQEALVKGDSRSISIAAASILAKVDRDLYMVEIAKNVHQDFGWARNKSYYSKPMIKALQKHGKTKYCREKYVRKFLDEVRK